MKPYRAPVALWASSAIGLVMMLLGDGVWDVVGLVAAAAPIFVIVRAAFEGNSR